MSDIILLSLLDYVKFHISAIYNAISQADITTAVNNFLSNDATIVVNGKSIYLPDFINMIQSEESVEVTASVTFNDSESVVVPTDPTNVNAGGAVGVSYVVTIQEKLRVQGGPQIRTIKAALNVFVDQDLSLTPPSVEGPRGLFDARRAMNLNLVFLQDDQPAPITLPDAAPTTV